MKKYILPILIPILLATPITSSGEPKRLKGSVALACQAMICLSDPMGDSMQECAPALKKYYSIVKVTKLGGIDKAATKLARDLFLNMCPKK